MGRKPSYCDSRNILRILRKLNSSRFGRVGFRNLCDMLQVSERTLDRYCQVFADEYDGLIGKERIGGEPYIVLNRFRLEGLTGYQLAPLYLSRFFLNFLKGTPLDEMLNETVRAFEEGLDCGEQQHLGALGRKLWVVSTGPKSYKDKEGLIDRLMRALFQQRRLEIEYHRPNEDETTRYLFEPYTMLIYKQGLYLIGSTERQAHRFFLAVERIVHCRLTDRYFDYPKDFHPREFCQGSFGIYHDKEERLAIRFSPVVAEYVRARNWHPTQSLESLDDGGLLLRMTVCGVQEVIPWVLSFGEHAEVLEPRTVRESMRNTLAALVDQYSPEGRS